MNSASEYISHICIVYMGSILYMHWLPGVNVINDDDILAILSYQLAKVDKKLQKKEIMQIYLLLCLERTKLIWCDDGSITFNSRSVDGKRQNHTNVSCSYIQHKYGWDKLIIEWPIRSKFIINSYKWKLKYIANVIVELYGGSRSTISGTWFTMMWTLAQQVSWNYSK